MHRIPRWVWIAAGVPCLLLILLTSAWAIDTLTHSDRVARNVTLAGQHIGGLSQAALGETVESLADDYEQVPVTVETPQGSLTATVSELGVAVDEDAVERDALRRPEQGLVVLRPFRWLGGLWGTHEAPLTFVVDRSRFERALTELTEANQVDPVEPSMQVGADGLELVAGQPGTALDTEGALDELVRAARHAAFPEVIEVGTVVVEPAFSDDDAQLAIDEANRLTAQPLTITVADRSTEVPRETLFGWVRLLAEGEELTVEVAHELVSVYLDEAFADLRVEPVDAGFTLTLAGVEITPDAPGQACCTPESLDRLVEALEAGESSVTLELEVLPPSRDVARAQELAIVEPIGSFTTNYAAGQSRVTNIHRIADLVRGAVIEPGETWSLNGHVGPRTRAKGFVEAGVIYRGIYQEDVGGGVSQFATTLFNAAFFGGLDFGEYQSHSIYISRYPRGREATVSYPHPDLQIINNTPFGVMIWTSYTSTSVTVELWSTKWVQAADLGTTDSRQGRCTRVTTQRLRTWPDGREEVDSVFAVYRPGEGVNC